MPEATGQATINGHGASQHRGRFAFADAELQRNLPALVAATEHLLAIAGVSARSVLSHLDGVRFHHIETGSGNPLVLIHGASGGCANWYRVLPLISQRRRVYAVDLPGFGFSEALHPVAPLGKQVAALLLRWLDAQRLDRVALGGTSFGGLIALRLAQLAPDRVTTLAVIDSVGLGRSLPLPMRLASLPLVSTVALRPRRSGLRWQFDTLMTADAKRLPPEERTALLEYMWQSARAANQSRLARGFRLFTSIAGQREILTDDELRAFRAQLLILWGEQDRFLPVAHARRAAALVPGAQCRIIPRAGHSPNWEAPAAVAECLDVFFPA